MNRRGLVHTIDSFFAVMILISALLYASQFPKENDYSGDRNLDALGMQVLVRLDGNGSLGHLINSGDWDGVAFILRLTLPTGISFNLTVLDEQGQTINDHEISNGGLFGRKIEVVEYLLAIESAECSIYRLRLQIGG